MTTLSATEAGKSLCNLVDDVALSQSRFRLLANGTPLVSLLRIEFRHHIPTDRNS